MRQVSTCLRQVYGARTLSKGRVRFWYDEFKNGRTRLVDQHRDHKRRTGRSPANIQAVKTLVTNDRRLTILAMHRELGISQSAIQRILTKDLHLRRRCAKMVLSLLTPQHLRERLLCSQLMLRHIRQFPGVLKKVITMDETWVYQYDLETKMQSSQWMSAGEPCPPKCRRPRAVSKCMLVTFFDWQGMVHFEFIRNQTINSQIFCAILQRLSVAIRSKRPRKRFYLHIYGQRLPAYISLDKAETSPHRTESVDPPPKLTRPRSQQLLVVFTHQAGSQGPQIPNFG